MKHLRSGLRAGLATAFCAALLAPAALADNGGKPPEERPGNSANAPGHNKDGDGSSPAAAAPDPPASPPSTAASPESVPEVAPAASTEGDDAETPSAVDARPDKPSQSERERPAHNATAKTRPAPKPRPGASDDSAKASSAHSKVLICHATGSDTNPYVLISVSVNAWSGGSGHGGHADDVFVDWSWPGDPRQKNDALCPGHGPGAPPTTTEHTSTTASSAPSPGAGDPGNEKTESTTGPAAERDEFGATMAPPVRKTVQTPVARRGVLGGSGRLADVAVRGTLPFTGIPLWAFALVGLGLVALGLGLRHRSVRARSF